MDSKTKAQDLTKSQKTLNKTYKLGSLFEKSDKKTELKKTSTHDNDSKPSAGITPKKDYVKTKQVDKKTLTNQAVRDEKTTKNTLTVTVIYTSEMILDDTVDKPTDTAFVMTTEMVGTQTTKQTSVINDVASLTGSATNKITADATHTTTFQAIEPSSIINKVTSDPESVTTTTKNTTFAFDTMTSAGVQATSVKTNLSRIGNNVTYELDHSTNKTTDVYLKTTPTKNATTTTQTTEISSVNNNLTSYPFTGLHAAKNMTATKSSTQTITSIVSNVTKNPDTMTTKLASSTTAASTVTSTNAIRTNRTTVLSENSNVTNYTDSVSSDVTSKTTNFPSIETPFKYFYFGGGIIVLFFVLLMIYLACRRSKKRRKFELRKKQRENKNVIGLEMGVYEEFKKSFYEKRPFDIENVDFAENVTEVTVV